MTARPAIAGATARPEPVSSKAFRDAMAQLACGVHIITTGEGAERAGLTASAVTSVSDAPAMMLACIKADSQTLAAIEANGTFCVNTLTEADQALAEVFAGRAGQEGEARFAGAAWGRLVTGAPALEGALACFDCRLVDVRTMATHRIVIGEVLALGGAMAGRALVYRNRHFSAL